MSVDAPLRRLALAVAGVIIAAWMLRPQLAQALVVRGDEQLYRGRASDALRYYDRAVRLNPCDGVAVDRYAFVALTLRKRQSVDAAIALASAYLLLADDDAVRFDRAMAYRERGRLKDALADFTRVGLHAHDATALTFAGLAAMRLGRRPNAIELFRRAVAFAPKWLPARRALRRLGATE